MLATLDAGMMAHTVGRTFQGVRDQVWRMVAFLGRYGHQRANDVLAMDYPDVVALAYALYRIIAEESKSGQGLYESMATGGG